MSPAVQADSGALLAAAAAAAGDLSRSGAAILAIVLALVTMAIVAVYLRHLNQRHARLLADLKTELAERQKAEARLQEVAPAAAHPAQPCPGPVSGEDRLPLAQDELRPAQFGHLVRVMVIHRPRLRPVSVQG